MAKLIVFDRYRVRGQCAISVIAACSMLERAVAKSMAVDFAPTYRDWDGVLAAANKLNIHNTSGHRQPASKYLQRPDQGGLLMRDGGQGPLEPVAELLTRLLAPYFEKGKPLGDVPSLADRLPREVIQLGTHLKKISETKHWYKTQLAEIEARRNLGEPPFSVFLERLSGDCAVPHPDFPGLQIVSDLAITSEFHHLAPVETPKVARSGLFVVVREARGWTVDTRDSHSTNTIVRDLLWIEDINAVVHGKTDVPGLYYSAYDERAYDVTARGDYEDALKLKNVLVTAKQAQDEDQRFELFFPIAKAPGTAEVRDAIIAGTGRNATQLGAWKALLTEPGWEQAERLETLIHVLRDRGGKPQILEQCLLEGGYCGTLYHDGLEGGFAIRDGFRKLLVGGRPQNETVRKFGGFVDAQIRRVLERAFARLQGEAAGSASAEAVEGAVAELNSLVKDRWHFIEPAQIVTFVSEVGDYRGFSREELQKLLEPLLALIKKPAQSA